MGADRRNFVTRGHSITNAPCERSTFKLCNAVVGAVAGGCQILKKQKEADYSLG